MYNYSFFLFALLKVNYLLLMVKLFIIIVIMEFENLIRIAKLRGEKRWKNIYW